MWGLFGWFFELLQSLGLGNKEATLVFLGVDDAGKTSLLQVLATGLIRQNNPTWHPSKDTLTLGSTTFQAIDLGGHRQARKLWQNYFHALDGIVFIVDAANPTRFEEVKAELHTVLMDEAIAGTPILILGNKIDKHGAVNEQELKLALGLNGQTTGKAQPRRSAGGSNRIRPLETFMCTVC